MSYMKVVIDKILQKKIRLLIYAILILLISTLLFFVSQLISAVLLHSYKQQSLSNENKNSSSENPFRSREYWTFNSSRPFCKDLVKHPRKGNRLCDRDMKSMYCKDGTVSMFTQHAQDYYLYTRHFSKLKRRGTYLDVAANHYSSGSTTFFFDECLGWDGVCVEANPEYHHELRMERNCVLIPTCVSDVEGERVPFVHATAGGGIEYSNKNMQIIYERNMSFNKSIMECTTINKVLMARNIKQVDYFSLDVEGHELRVLRGINWEQVVFNIISVEVSETSFRSISDFLISKGYIFHTPVQGHDKLNIKNSLLSEDAFFIHKSVRFGKPS